VKLYEIFEDEQYFYLIFELMTGGELFERLSKEETFSEKQAAETI
jgi:serine/threonine protein kinase